MTVTIYADGELVHTVSTVNSVGNTFSFAFPFHLVQNDRDLQVHWKFNYLEEGVLYVFEQTTTVSIITPILPLATIATIIGSTATSDDVREIEHATRLIIQAHTGQNFGKFVGKKTITGSGDSALRMPARLLKLNKVNDSDVFLPNLIIRGDGWYIKNVHQGIPPLKADFYGLHYLANGVIEAPARVPRLTWMENVEYTIDGEWGWENVPAAVGEAAKLLISDYSCADSNYRDRYLSMIAAADWKIQFNSGAYSATGNVRADQLLSNYVLKRGWAVV